jgi:uncharacterized protein YceK
MRTKIMLIVVSLQLAGCSTVVQQLGQDRRAAPWDPKGSASLMDQIPNEDGGALRRCCGHLRTCQAHQTPRC